MTNALSIKYAIKRYYAFLLCASFILGAFAGMVIASNNADHFALLVCLSSEAQISPAALFAQTALPFSLTILIYSTEKRNLLFALCFLSSLAYGVAVASVYFAYGSGQWLISQLLLFSSTSRQVSLLWLWLRNSTWRRNGTYRDFLTALGVSVLAAVADISLISPRLLSLFY